MSHNNPRKWSGNNSFLILSEDAWEPNITLVTVTTDVSAATIVPALSFLHKDGCHNVTFQTVMLEYIFLIFTSEK